MLTLKELSEKLIQQKEVAIFCHMRPDGDSIGSALALKLAMQSLGAKADVFCVDNIPEKFLFIDQATDIKKEFGGEYSALVSVDCGDASRFTSSADFFIKHKNTFNIDHHISNTRFAKLNYVEDCAACAEIIYSLIKIMKVKITKEISNLLALGIITDTGNFKHKNVTERTFRISGELIGYGADFNLINYKMFNEQTPARAKLFGITMSKIRYFHEGRLAIACARQTDFLNSGAKHDETEGFIDFVMGISGLEVGVCIMEIKENSYKVSFRSKGKTDVNEVASTFGGGGHKLASGCIINGDFEEVLDKIQYAVYQHLKD